MYLTGSGKVIGRNYGDDNAKEYHQEFASYSGGPADCSSDDRLRL